MDKKKNRLKKTELQTLRTFQKENPSQYFSHFKNKKFYLDYQKNIERIYTEYLKLPIKLFNNSEIIDLGAGTGDNTIHFSNWGAKCSLVEMNSLAINIAKKLFKKYAKNKTAHKFIKSSVFDFKSNKKYEFVKCTGVLSHTADKEKAFKKIAKLVKPGGFFIFGDQTKSGEFQNMLQRYAVFNLTHDDEEMVKICEYLFKNDIDRSQKAVPRTRRAIIFDRWIIQQQDDPTVKNIIEWASKSNLKLYSSFPSITSQLEGDSRHYKRKRDLNKFYNIFSLPELIWMSHTEQDEKFLKKINNNLKNFSSSLNNLINHVSNISLKKRINRQKFSKFTLSLESEFSKVDPIKELKGKIPIFLKEARDFIKLVDKRESLYKMKKFISKSKYLFKGTCGNKNLDFVFIKNKNNF